MGLGPEEVCVDDGRPGVSPNSQNSLPYPDGQPSTPGSNTDGFKHGRGLFVTWKMVFGLVIFLAWFARVAYIKLKRRWWKKVRLLDKSSPA
jgi:hypothetical protein